uniref:p1 protamine n=1 Tax=Styela montereyensis TaxID=30291 RepID=Q7YXH7_STYMO|nr:P1 protamine [Styela montereyensis]
MTPATSEESIAVPDPSGRRTQGRHPTYNVMVKRAITTLKNKNGASSKSIARYLTAHFNVKKNPCKKAVARCLKRMVSGGLIYKNKRNLYKLTGKGRKMRGKRRRRGRKSIKKAGRRRRRRRGRKSKKGKKGRKGRRRRRKRGRKARKGRKTRRRRRRRRSAKKPKRAGRRRRRGGKRGRRTRRRRRR